MKNLRQLLESRLYDTGDNFHEAARRAANQILTLLPEKASLRKIEPTDLSVREIFDTFVVEKVRRDGGDVAGLLGGNTMQIAEAINTSQFPRLIGRMASVSVLDEYERALEDVNELVTEEPDLITGDWAHFARITGQDLPELVHEGQAYEETHMGEWEAAIQLHKFGRTIKLTKEMVLADRTGKIVSMARDYGELMGYHRQREIIETACGRASTATGRAAADSFLVNGTGYAIYSDDHSAEPGSGGQTNDNNLTSTAISSDGYAAVLLKLRKIKDIHGLPLMIRPTHVIVAPEQEETARKLLTFNVEPGLTSGGQDSNIYRNRYKVIVDPDGTDGTWFMGQYRKQVRWVWGWRPNTEVGAPVSLALSNDIVSVIKASYKGGCGNVDDKFAAKAAA